MKTRTWRALQSVRRKRTTIGSLSRFENVERSKRSHSTRRLPSPPDQTLRGDGCPEGGPPTQRGQWESWRSGRRDDENTRWARPARCLMAAQEAWLQVNAFIMRLVKALTMHYASKYDLDTCDWGSSGAKAKAAPQEAAKARFIWKVAALRNRFLFKSLIGCWVVEMVNWQLQSEVPAVFLLTRSQVIAGLASGWENSSWRFQAILSEYSPCIALMHFNWGSSGAKAKAAPQEAAKARFIWKVAALRNRFLFKSLIGCWVVEMVNWQLQSEVPAVFLLTRSQVIAGLASGWENSSWRFQAILSEYSPCIALMHFNWGSIGAKAKAAPQEAAKARFIWKVAALRNRFLFKSLIGCWVVEMVNWQLQSEVPAVFLLTRSQVIAGLASGWENSSWRFQAILSEYSPCIALMHFNWGSSGAKAKAAPQEAAKARFIWKVAALRNRFLFKSLIGCWVVEMVNWQLQSEVPAVFLLTRSQVIAGLASGWENSSWRFQAILSEYSPCIALMHFNWGSSGAKAKAAPQEAAKARFIWKVAALRNRFLFKSLIGCWVVEMVNWQLQSEVPAVFLLTRSQVIAGLASGWENSSWRFQAILSEYSPCIALMHFNWGSSGAKAKAAPQEAAKARFIWKVAALRNRFLFKSLIVGWVWQLDNPHHLKYLPFQTLLKSFFSFLSRFSFFSFFHLSRFFCSKTGTTRWQRSLVVTPGSPFRLRTSEVESQPPPEAKVASEEVKAGPVFFFFSQKIQWSFSKSFVFLLFVVLSE